MTTYRELLEQVKAEIAEVDAREAQAASGAAWIDVRESDEWQEGHIPGAVHVPRGYLESRIEGVVPDKTKPIIYSMSSPLASTITITSGATTLATLNLSCTAADPDVAATNGTLPPEPTTTTVAAAKPAATAANFTG